MLLLKIEIIPKNRLTQHFTRSTALLKAKEGQILQNPVFEHWVAAGRSGTPPNHSSVFVDVFDLRLEFTRAPVVASAAENRKIIGNCSGRRPQ